MKGMTNNQIIMNEAAKLDPVTLHAIATAHHTPEQIAAMAANAVTTDENGDEQPATIADVEIILAAAELHTFDHWKKEGKSVKKGETHLIECYLWKYTTRPSKAQREAAEAEGKEAAPAPHFYPTKSHLFSCLQVHDAKQAPAGRFGSVAAIMEYNKSWPQNARPQRQQQSRPPAPRPPSSPKSTTNCRSWCTSIRCPRKGQQAHRHEKARPGCAPQGRAGSKGRFPGCPRNRPQGSGRRAGCLAQDPEGRRGRKADPRRRSRAG